MSIFNQSAAGYTDALAATRNAMNLGFGAAQVPAVRAFTHTTRAAPMAQSYGMGNGATMDAAPMARAYGMGNGATMAPAMRAQAYGMGNGATMNAAPMARAYGMGNGATMDAALMAQPGLLAQTNMGQYMNPYINQVVDRATADMNRGRQMALGDVGAQATAAGAFGGSRHGLVEAETNRGFADSIGQMASGLRQQGYNNAQAAAQFDIGNMMAAGQFNAGQQQQANMANTNNAQAAAQFNAGQRQQNSQFNVGNRQQVNMVNANNAQAAAQFNAGQRQQNSQFNVGNRQQANMVNANNAQAAAQFNAGQRQQNSQYNVGNRQQANMVNANNAQAAAQFNAGQQQQNSQYNAGNRLQNMQFNTGQRQQNSQFNAGNLQQVNLANAANTLQAQQMQAGNYLASGAQMGGLAGQGFGMGQAVNDMQAQAGGQQQAQMQALIDAARAQYAGWQQSPYQALSANVGALSGAPSPTTTTQSSNPGLLGLLGAGAGAASALGWAPFALCWLARAVYGDDRWLGFRKWMLLKSPDWLFRAYAKNGPAWAEWVNRNPWSRRILRPIMDAARAQVA